MTANLAKRMQQIRPFEVMRILGRARELEAAGRDIVHMEVGEPDFPTPTPIVEAGIAALQAGHHHYTPATGLPALRQAVANHYAHDYGLQIDPTRILITPGSSAALQLILTLLVNPGDRVLLTDPGYPCNRHFVVCLNGEPFNLPVTANQGYQPSVEQVSQAWSQQCRALLLASPANPTGALLSRPHAQALLDVTQPRGGHLIVDEIYQGLVYEGDAFTALELSDEVVVVNSFSKYYGMTGWRRISTWQHPRQHSMPPWPLSGQR